MAEAFSDSSKPKGAAKSLDGSILSLGPNNLNNLNNNNNVASLQNTPWPRDVVELIAQQNRHIAQGFRRPSGQPETRVQFENFISYYPNSSNPDKEVVVTEVVTTTRRFTTPTATLKRVLGQNGGAFSYQNIPFSPFYHTQPVVFSTSSFNMPSPSMSIPGRNPVSRLLEPTSSFKSPSPPTFFQGQTSGYPSLSLSDRNISRNPSMMNAVNNNSGVRSEVGMKLEGEDVGSVDPALADLQLSRDGKTHSLPHRKYGPYKCPRCGKVFLTSQTFASHMKPHYKHETSDQKRRRWTAKCRKRNVDFHVVDTRLGMTLTPDVGRGGREHQRRRMNAERDVEVVEAGAPQIVNGTQEANGGGGRRGIRRETQVVKPENMDEETVNDSNSGPEAKPTSSPGSLQRVVGVLIKEPANNHGSSRVGDTDGDDGMKKWPWVIASVPVAAARSTPCVSPRAVKIKESPATSNAVKEPETGMSERAIGTSVGSSKEPSFPSGTSSQAENSPSLLPRTVMKKESDVDAVIIED